MVAKSVRALTVLVVLYCVFFKQEKFQAIIYASKAYEDDAKTVENLWQDCKDPMYSLNVKLRQLGFGDQVTNLVINDLS